MKRFWLVLLSLGLIVAFSTQAMAVDVKFSGEYYAAGLYLDKTNVNKTQYTIPAVVTPALWPAPYGGKTLAPARTIGVNNSTAFYFQRLRLGAQFVVSPGLSLITRADIMERAWGATRSSGTAVSTNPFTGAVTGASASQDILSAGTRAENENIVFDLLYVSYASPIGLFNVGYQIDGAWGTVFGDSSQPTPKIAYYLPIGSLGIGLQMGKNPDGELSNTRIFASDGVDKDNSFYTAFVRYAWKGGDAGLLGKYVRNATTRNAGAAIQADGFGVKTEQYILVPYVKAKLGPVALQAEFTWVQGKAKRWEGTTTATATMLAPYVASGLLPLGQDVDLNSMTGWIDATADLGMFYAGGTLAFVSGDDEGTKDKMEAGATGGLDWNPCLIMFNSDLNYWAGNINGYGTAMGAPMNNAYFLQVRGGVRPIEKLDIGLSYSWARAEKSLGPGFDNRDYGQEIDLTATYKITNNLSYMLGGGYWLTGKFYQGNTPTNNELSDNFMVINKLTLTF